MRKKPSECWKTASTGKDPIKDVIKVMTLEEKAKLVAGNGFRIPGAALQGPVIIKYG